MEDGIKNISLAEMRKLADMQSAAHVEPGIDWATIYDQEASRVFEVVHEALRALERHWAANAVRLTEDEGIVRNKVRGAIHKLYDWNTKLGGKRNG